MGWNQQRIFLIERKLWVAADLKIVGVAMVLWDETHAWNCLFVVRLQMRTWNNASKRPEGYYNIVEIPFRFVLKHVACKISGVIWKNQCQENSQVQKTQFCSLFLDDACDAYWSLMLVHHRPRVPTRNSRSSKLWCRVRELNGIQQKWACLEKTGFYFIWRCFFTCLLTCKNMVYTCLHIISFFCQESSWELEWWLGDWVCIFSVADSRQSSRETRFQDWSFEYASFFFET